MWKKRRNGMELVKIKGVQKNKPAREECKNMLTMADIIEGVNAVLNPGKPKINWFAPADDAVAAVHIKDGKYDEATSNPSVVYGGKVSDNKVENLKVVAYEGTEGAIYAEGAGTDVTVDTAYISLAGYHSMEVFIVTYAIGNLQSTITQTSPQ